MLKVNRTHADYDASLKVWQRARDVLAGEDAVKAAGEAYLSRLEGQTDAEFAAYVKRASFFNATARTSEGFVGMIFRREVITKLPGAGPMQALVLDVDMAGGSLYAYAKRIVTEVIAIGRAGTLVDWDDREGRVYFADYKAENILNWRTTRLGGRSVLSLVVLRELVEETAADGLSVVEVEQIRVLKLVDANLHPPAAGESQYEVEIWRLLPKAGKKKESEWTLVRSVTPLRAGRPLNAIPFVFHGAETCRSEVQPSPLKDIIPINLDHYRLDADYKHGIHFTALPTAWAAGFSPDAVPRIGSSVAWLAEQPGATAGFLEFTGKGLTTFQIAQDHDERLMAVMGARVLFSQKRVAESAEAMALRMVGEDSILATLSRSCSEGLTTALRWAVWWTSPSLATLADVEPSMASLELNSDFSATGLSGKDLTAVVAAWQAGALDDGQLKDILKRGELLPLTEAEGTTKDSLAPARSGSAEPAGTPHPGPLPSALSLRTSFSSRVVILCLYINTLCIL